MRKNEHKRKPIVYPGFSNWDPEVVKKILEERRPYCSDDFKDRPRNYMIPDLRETYADKQRGC